MTCARTKAGWPRFLAMVALAYALMLNGLLSAMASGAHVAEARIAAQLGIICTIHGTGNFAADDTQAPTPGKLACIEHCVLVLASTMPAMPEIGSAIGRPDRFANAPDNAVSDAGRLIAPVSAPPPSRGPPALI